MSRTLKEEIEKTRKDRRRWREKLKHKGFKEHLIPLPVETSKALEEASERQGMAQWKVAAQVLSEGLGITPAPRFTEQPPKYGEKHAE